jgi:hypothetical protein
MLMLFLFDNCDVSSGSGDDVHNFNYLQSGKPKIDCSKYLSLYLINATSLAKPHAIQLLQTELLNKNFDIVLVTETWFTQMHLNTYVMLPNYVLFRRDRGRRGGGVCAYVRSDINCVVASFRKISAAEKKTTTLKLCGYNVVTTM